MYNILVHSCIVSIINHNACGSLINEPFDSINICCFNHIIHIILSMYVCNKYHTACNIRLFAHKLTSDTGCCSQQSRENRPTGKPEWPSLPHIPDHSELTQSDTGPEPNRDYTKESHYHSNSTEESCYHSDHTEELNSDSYSHTKTVGILFIYLCFVLLSQLHT